MTAPAASTKPKSSPIRILLVVVPLIAVVVLAALYQEQIASAWAQQAWNPGAAESAVRTFVEKGAGPEGAQTAALLDPQVFKTQVEGGRLVTITSGQAMARRTTPVKKFVRDGKPAEVRTDFLAKDGGSFRVLVHYGDGQWGEFRAKRQEGAMKIVRLPDSFSPNPPPRIADEY